MVAAAVTLSTLAMAPAAAASGDNGHGNDSCGYDASNPGQSDGVNNASRKHGGGMSTDRWHRARRRRSGPVDNEESEAGDEDAKEDDSDEGDSGDV